MTENKRGYDAIVNWVENPSIKTFLSCIEMGSQSVSSGGVLCGESGASSAIL